MNGVCRVDTAGATESSHDPTAYAQYLALHAASVYATIRLLQSESTLDEMLEYMTIARAVHATSDTDERRRLRERLGAITTTLRLRNPARLETAKLDHSIHVDERPDVAWASTWEDARRLLDNLGYRHISFRCATENHAITLVFYCPETEATREAAKRFLRAWQTSAANRRRLRVRVEYAAWAPTRWTRDGKNEWAVSEDTAHSAIEASRPARE